MLEVLGTALLLVAIVWLVYRYDDAPASEYMKVLDEISVEGYAHYDTQAIEKEIEATRESLERLEATIAQTKRPRTKKRLLLRQRLMRLNLSLLEHELEKRHNNEM